MADAIVLAEHSPFRVPRGLSGLCPCTLVGGHESAWKGECARLHKQLEVAASGSCCPPLWHHLGPDLLLSTQASVINKRVPAMVNHSFCLWNSVIYTVLN